MRSREGHLVEVGSPEFVAAVAEALASIAAGGVAAQPKTQRKWYPTGEARELLGMASVQALYRWRDRQGRNIKEGKHYRKTSSPRAKRSTYEWHVEACQELISTPNYKLR